MHRPEFPELLSQEEIDANVIAAAQAGVDLALFIGLPSLAVLVFSLAALSKAAGWL